MRRGAAVPTVAEIRVLARAARAARRRAYAPYSQFRVGAAVLTGSGKIITGCNVENASYGLSMCAERVAIQRAVAEGHRRIKAVAVAAPGSAMPCGACRQVMREFGITHVVIAGTRGTARLHTLADLLPAAFGPADLR